jgi:chromosome segregation ATPase
MMITHPDQFRAMTTELEQLNARAEAAEQWQHTFAGLGGTPEIAWAFYKGLENNKIAWQQRAEAAEARVAELTDEHTELAGKLDVACHRNEVLATQVAELEAINALRVPGSCQCADDDLCAFAKRGEAAEARVAELETELGEARQAGSMIAKECGEAQAQARVAEARVAELKLELNAARLSEAFNAFECVDAQCRVAELLRDNDRLIEAGDLLVASESLEVGWHEAVAAWQELKEASQ